MSRWMLDTDICSFILRRSNERVLRRLRSIAVGDAAISVITKAELLCGAALSARRDHDSDAVEAFLRHLDVVAFADSAAAHYAEIRADLKRRGAMIGANDLLIAAHARSLGLTLVTNNTREFGRVRGLEIENWTLPSG
jgi:tRNA(fMet)-specific endonuclease VapC